jgi:hypothetical protein
MQDGYTIERKRQLFDEGYARGLAGLPISHYATRFEKAGHEAGEAEREALFALCGDVGPE